MADLIDRQKTLEKIYQLQPFPIIDRDAYEFYRDVRESIKSMPSAQQWIPVSEKVPEKYQYVLVTYKGLDGRKLVVTTNWNPNTWIESNSVAWMPLPEPYKKTEVSE